MTWYEESFDALTGLVGAERKAALEALIKTWETLEPRPSVTEIRKFVLPVLSNYRDPSTDTWKQAKPGFLHLSDYVRVRKDAFDDGRFANVEARVVAIRNGAVSVKALNEEDAGVERLSFKITQLDKRVAR
jgi:hypothetical protein